MTSSNGVGEERPEQVSISLKIFTEVAYYEIKTEYIGIIKDTKMGG